MRGLAGVLSLSACASLATRDFDGFISEKEVAIGSWTGSVSEGRASFDDVGRDVEFSVLSSLMAEREVRAFMEEVRTYNKWNVVRDSVDNVPAYEAYLDGSTGEFGREGSAQHGRLKKLLAPLVNERVLPFVNDKFADVCHGDCLVCESLVRRYLEGERRGLESHQDMNALVTVVVALNSAGVDYDGGLYVQGTGHTDPRRRLRLLRGDAVAHRSNLLHGVDVTWGARYSLVLWLERGQCGSEDPVTWHLEDAKTGDAVSQYSAAMMLKDKPDDSSKKQSLSLMQQSAEKGLGLAASMLGTWFFHGMMGLHQDRKEGVRWLQAASDSHWAHGAYLLGSAYLKAGQKELATKYLKHAAALGNSKSKLVIGELALQSGELKTAAEMFEEAWTPDSLYLRMRLQGQMGSGPESPEVLRWLEAAARLGQKEACELYVGAPDSKQGVIVTCLTMQLYDGNAQSFKRLLKLYRELLAHPSGSSDHGESVFAAQQALQNFAEKARHQGKPKPAQLLAKVEKRKAEL